MRLTVIGCSGLFPSSTSPASSYLLETEDTDGRTWRAVLDLGNGALGPLQRFVQPNKLDAILLTSLDLDHCADLACLYIALRYASSGPSSVTIYGPPGTLAHLINICGSKDADEIPKVYRVLEWVDSRPITLGPLTVKPLRMNHPGQAFGLRIEESGAAIAYSGDTDICPALTSLASEADLLLAEATFRECECSRAINSGHMTGRDAGAVAKAAGVGQLVLTHLSIWADKDAILADATISFAGQTSLAEPNQVYRVIALN